MLLNKIVIIYSVIIWATITAMRYFGASWTSIAAIYMCFNFIGGVIGYAYIITVVYGENLVEVLKICIRELNNFCEMYRHELVYFICGFITGFCIMFAIMMNFIVIYFNLISWKMIICSYGVSIWIYVAIFFEVHKVIIRFICDIMTVSSKFIKENKLLLTLIIGAGEAVFLGCVLYGLGVYWIWNVLITLFVSYTSLGLWDHVLLDIYCNINIKISVWLRKIVE